MNYDNVPFGGGSIDKDLLRTQRMLLVAFLMGDEAERLMMANDQTFISALEGIQNLTDYIQDELDGIKWT